MTGPDSEFIRGWMTRVLPRAAVEAIESPPGFVAERDPAPGALSFGYTTEEALEEMRSVLCGWASLVAETGGDLPEPPPDP